MKNITQKYTNGEITVVWKPGQCIHSAECIIRLGKVFNPSQRPWVKMNVASTGEIKEAIDNCPSKALSYFDNDEAKS